MTTLQGRTFLIDSPCAHPCLYVMKPIHQFPDCNILLLSYFCRSSPFFWAFRKALRDIEDPVKILGPKMLSESIFKITDSLPFKSVGQATQSFTVADNLMDGESIRGSLKSSMELKVQFAGSSQMTTSSSWRTTEEPDLLEIEIEKTEVLESSIQSLLNPFISMIPKQITDNLSSFPSGAALELVKYVSSICISHSVSTTQKSSLF